METRAAPPFVTAPGSGEREAIIAAARDKAVPLYLSQRPRRDKNIRIHHFVSFSFTSISYTTSATRLALALTPTGWAPSTRP